MAADYTVVSQRRSVQVLSQTQVIDVEEVGFVTHPSNVYAQREVPLAAWTDGGAAAWVAPLAGAIEDLISGGLASGATFVQDVDPASGLLADFLDFLVTYTPSGGVSVMSTTVRVPVNALTLDTSFGGFVTGGSPTDQLRAAYDQLVATANL